MTPVKSESLKNACTRLGRVNNVSRETYSVKFDSSLADGVRSARK